uniref:Uncharacterized protein n=1 Tax=Tetradesmus obliquus TaxID=3088 RepID=A0A383WE03_TETOB|eukprot:jgi/Sobl393_1/9269/SZX75835.1
MKWLCCTAGKQAVAAASDAVVAVPNVPAAVVQVLTAAGVRISDAQAMAAALKQQPGIELWLQARLDLRWPDVGFGSSSDAELCAAFSTVQQDWTSAPAAAAASAGASSASAAVPAAGGRDIPSLLEVLAEFRVWEFSLDRVARFVQPSLIPDVLRFAVNQLRARSAAALVKHLSTPPEKLLSALLYEQEWQLEHAAEEQQQQQQLPPPPPLVFVGNRQQDQHAQQQQQHEQQQQQHAESHIKHMHSLQQQQLTPALLDELLLLAADRRHYPLLLQLLQLPIPGPQQLPSSTMYAVLRSVLQDARSSKWQADLSRKLCELPAARLLDAAQVYTLLLAAAQQQFTMWYIAQLPGAGQLSSAQANVLASAAVDITHSCAVRHIVNVVNLLQPRQLVQLLQRTLLLATLAGEGTGEEDGDGKEEPWCDARMSALRIPYSESNRVDRLEVLEYLCAADVAAALDADEVAELLVAAAELGDCTALTLLLEHLPNAAAADSDTARRLLEVALQHRHSKLLSKVASCFSQQLRLCFCECADEAATCLLRADDKQLLAQMVHQLLSWMPWYVEDGLPQLLQLAVRLRRSEAVPALHGKLWSRKPLKHELPVAEVQALLRAAARSSSSSIMVHSLMLLPGAQRLPGRGLQLVMDECCRRGNAAAAAAAAHWERSRGMAMATAAAAAAAAAPAAPAVSSKELA